jgi:hypothetical protein
MHLQALPLQCRQFFVKEKPERERIGLWATKLSRADEEYTAMRGGIFGSKVATLFPSKSL